MDQSALETASVDDVAELLALREELASWLAVRGIDQWRSPMPRDRLVAWVRGGSVRVVRRDGRIVASVTLLDRDEDFWGRDSVPALYVHLLMVARSHAGRDLGGRVLARAEALARDRGVDRVRLDAAAPGQSLDDLAPACQDQFIGDVHDRPRTSGSYGRIGAFPVGRGRVRHLS